MPAFLFESNQTAHQWVRCFVLQVSTMQLFLIQRHSFCSFNGMRFLLFLFLISMTFYSCSLLTAPNAINPLKNKSYKMVSYFPAVKSKDSFPNGMPEVSFSGDSSIKGRTGCNSFFGTYNTSGNKLKADITGMTKMFCMGVDETGFMDLFQSADSFQMENKNLFLYHKGKKIMTLIETNLN